jgi:hypothetical protein
MTLLGATPDVLGVRGEQRADVLTVERGAEIKEDAGVCRCADRITIGTVVGGRCRRPREPPIVTFPALLEEPEFARWRSSWRMPGG